MASSDLIWLLVKNSNRYLVKRNGNSSASVQFSSEPNNLYNLNTYKYSGLANPNTVGINAADKPGENLDIVLTTSVKRKSNQPTVVNQRSILKKDFTRKSFVVVNQVAENKYRPDLKRAALARLAAVHKSLVQAKRGTSGKKKSRKTTSKPLVA